LPRNNGIGGLNMRTTLLVVAFSGLLGSLGYWYSRSVERDVPRPVQTAPKKTALSFGRVATDETQSFSRPSSSALDHSDDPVGRRLKSRADVIYAALARNDHQAACTPDVRSDLERLLADAEGYENLWTWTFERALQCSRAVGADDSLGKLLTNAMRRHRDNPRVLELLAEHNLRAGHADKAVRPATDALRIRESYQALDVLAGAYLSMADMQRASKSGDPGQARGLYLEAMSAASRAAELATPAMRPFQYLNVAQAQLGLGEPLRALDTAARAEQAIHAASARSQAHFGPLVYMQLGSIYYRAGHRDIGIAYMDQAIAMAGGDAKLRDFKEQVLKSTI
jgi:tetratricopeptide (TPR) repeat protein